MDITLIAMPAEEARARYDLYRTALADREKTKEDRGILIGYKALAQGRTILDLGKTFRNCPFDDLSRPKLAFGRAHWQLCHLYRYGDGSGRFAETNRDLDSYRRRAFARIELGPGTFSQRCDYKRWRCVAPIIPPNLRPKDALQHYFVLWEAAWEAVPTDPMLLSHLHGNLYAVLAVWDLSELERSVLAGRLTESR